MKLIALFSIALLLAACSSHSQAEEAQAEPPLFVEFDWSTVPVSTAEIGDFPYITASGSFDIEKGGFYDFNQLIMFNGTSFWRAEGKLLTIHFKMTDGLRWNKYKFDRSINPYLESIGAKRVFKGGIPSSLLDRYEEEKHTWYEYMTCTSRGAKVNYYALNHVTGRIVFQVCSGSSKGSVGVLELESFKQTIQAPTASKMKQDIEKEGKAVLNILFDTDKATLKPEGQKVVNQIQALLESNPDLNLSIEGHTDDSGTAERNQELSVARANAVMYSLAAKGIDIQRLKTAGFGAEKPVVANDSKENKAKNRRVELIKF